MGNLSQGPIRNTDTKSALTGSSPDTASVGTSSSEVLPSNSNRKGLVIVNTSENIVSLSFGSNPAVLNNGITLFQYGVFNMDEYMYTTEAINAIANVGSSVISIQEFI